MGKSMDLSQKVGFLNIVRKVVLIGIIDLLLRFEQRAGQTMVGTPIHSVFYATQTQKLTSFRISDFEKVGILNIARKWVLICDMDLRMRLEQRGAQTMVGAPIHRLFHKTQTQKLTRFLIQDPTNSWESQWTLVKKWEI